MPNVRALPVLVACLAINACGDPARNAPQQLDVEPMVIAAQPGSAEPNLSSGTEGEIVLSWLEPVGGNHALRFATLRNGEWSSPATVAESDDWFVNWADFPSVVPISGDLWAAHWLAKTPGGVYAYDVNIAVSLDQGASWSAPITPHTDNTRTEHGFVTLYPGPAGLAAIWLDGRNMIEDSSTHDHADMEGTAGGMTLRSTGLTPGLERRNEQLMDDLVCDCCQTDVALASSGPIAVYRNRTSAEIRDIYVARSLDGSWQPGVAVSDDDWKIAGCPVNGPAIAAHGDQVVVAWFTAANNDPRVRVAFSSNSAVSFSDPVDVDAGEVLGRVGVALLPDRSAAASWMTQRDNVTAEIRLRRVFPNGTMGPVSVLATTSSARRAGFPQLVATTEGLLLAWTEINQGKTQVRAGRVRLAELD